MHSDGTLDGHIGVLLGSIESLKIGVEAIELHLDLGTSGELLLLRARHAWGGVLSASLNIEFTRDLVLVTLHELSDHRPDHMELLALGRWHGLAEIEKLFLSLLQFDADLLHDLGEVVSNMGEQYAGQLSG